MSHSIKYLFDFGQGKKWEYTLSFDDKNRLVPQPNSEFHSWTGLEFSKCPHCPLNVKEHPQCPVARNIDRTVEDSKDAISFERATVTVITDERSYFKECDSQLGLRSIYGLVMATSGCPHLDWLRPLARFHLPFATLDETLFRAVSLQLLTEFFSEEKKLQGTQMSRMHDKYAAVKEVNHSFISRIRNYCEGDASKNAITGLDLFVQLFELQSEDDFSSLRKYLE